MPNQTSQSQTPVNPIPWIAITHLQSLNLLKLRSWLLSHDQIQNLFSADVSELKAAGFTVAEIEKITTLPWSQIEEEAQWLESQGSLITLNDPLYPALLKELSDPPLALYARGDLNLLSSAQLGVVGSRHPSPLGIAIAQRFAAALAEKGLTISSGLAAGIDAAAHRGALGVQGKTIAVMGTGLDQIYPASHRSLSEAIVQQGGLLLTEFPRKTLPTPWNFPRRNRIISGLSLGILVVEAALRSGSLITARFALEQNREVFAIPGSIQQPLARGCHQLIRQGATLVESVDDILTQLCSLRAFLKTSQAAEPAPLAADLDTKQRLLLSAIDYALTPVDSMVQRSGLTAASVCSMLLELELKGYVQAVPGGYQRSN